MLKTCHKLRSFIAVSAVFAMTVSCVDLSEPLDPDKPFPGNILQENTAAPRCAFETLNPQPMDLQFHVIDVGQGDALLIRTPDDGMDGNGIAEGLTILIDAGNNGELESSDGARFVKSWLDQFDITSIDYAFVTHAHVDHFGGMVDLFDVVDIKNVVDPGYDQPMERYNQFVSKATRITAANGGTYYRPAISATTGLVAQAGDALDWGQELQVRLLHGSTVANLGERDNTQVNNTSIVIHLDYKGSRILLMGDAEKELEQQLAASGFDMTAEVLKVGHHGSATSSSDALLGAVWPAEIPPERRYSIISAGRKDFSGTQLPSLSTLFRLRTEVGARMGQAPERVFSTEYNDANKDEKEAPGDDNVVVILREDGAIDACYVR